MEDKEKETQEAQADQVEPEVEGAAAPETDQENRTDSPETVAAAAGHGPGFRCAVNRHKGIVIGVTAAVVIVAVVAFGATVRHSFGGFGPGMMVGRGGAMMQGNGFDDGNGGRGMMQGSNFNDSNGGRGMMQGRVSTGGNGTCDGTDCAPAANTPAAQATVPSAATDGTQLSAAIAARQATLDQLVADSDRTRQQADAALAKFKTGVAAAPAPAVKAPAAAAASATCESGTCESGAGGSGNGPRDGSGNRYGGGNGSCDGSASGMGFGRN